jgi:hypothetical protein
MPRLCEFRLKTQTNIFFFVNEFLKYAKEQAYNQRTAGGAAAKNEARRVWPLAEM